jgi:hypothetical protein
MTQFYPILVASGKVPVARDAPAASPELEGRRAPTLDFSNGDQLASRMHATGPTPTPTGQFPLSHFPAEALGRFVTAVMTGGLERGVGSFEVLQPGKFARTVDPTQSLEQFVDGLRQAEYRSAVLQVGAFGPTIKLTVSFGSEPQLFAFFEAPLTPMNFKAVNGAHFDAFGSSIR